jgi:hypothetical protein
MEVLNRKAATCESGGQLLIVTKAIPMPQGLFLPGAVKRNKSGFLSI